MDLMTILGLVMGCGAVYYVMARGQITSLLFNLSAAILVFGGTFASTLITYPFRIIRQGPRALKLVLFPSQRYSAPEAITALVRLAEVARRGGIGFLANEIHNLRDNFLVDGIQMVIDNLDPEMIRENLEKEIVFTRRRHQQVSGIFRTMGTYAPIFGLLGTLIGVVQVLRNLADPKTMAASMAIAVTTTFYGIFGTNFIFLPIAGKLNAHSEEELLIKEVIIEGIISIQKGEIPLIVERKLQAFLAYRFRRRV